MHTDYSEEKTQKGLAGKTKFQRFRGQNRILSKALK